MSDYTQSNTAQILEAVSTELARRGFPVICELGDAAAAAHAAAPRIVFVFAEGEVEAAARQPEDGHVIDYERQLYDVTVTGTDEAAAEKLRFTLRLALDHLFSLWTAQVPPNAKIKRAPDGITSSRSSFVMPVQLRVPNYAAEWVPVTIDHTTVHGQTSRDALTTPEANP